MGKYNELQKDIFSIFGTQTWKDENIKTVPSNYSGAALGNEYIRITIIPGREGLNLTSSAGVLSIDIFTPAGDGPNRASLIADKLDEFLIGKHISANLNATQMGRSTLQPFGVDKDNPALYRSIYSITFNYFGV